MRIAHFGAVLCAAIALSGCATRAAIADLEEDKVVVEASGNDMSVIQAEARRGCSIHGRNAVPISHRCMDNYCIRAQYLFACKQ